MGQGTREQFSKWLQEQKRLTYTAYNNLPTPAKASVYEEYLKSKRKGVQNNAESQEQKEG